jgi:hypothetical protein
MVINIQFKFKCKMCNQEFAEPSLNHIKEHYLKMIEGLEKMETGQFFDLVFKQEWKQ